MNGNHSGFASGSETLLPAVSQQPDIPLLNKLSTDKFGAEDLSEDESLHLLVAGL